METKNRICPVEAAGFLDIKIRRWFQNPKKILKPYVKEGMTALDIGCGPGFFTIPMAQFVGETGKVIAADLQEGMLERLKKKIESTELDERIKLHKTETNRIGISEKVDFILAFYMIHEVPDQKIFFNELRSLLNAGGTLLIVEPKFHVSKSGFKSMISIAEAAGVKVIEYPHLLLSRGVLLK